MDLLRDSATRFLNTKRGGDDAVSKFYSLHFNVHELGRPGAEAAPKGLAWAIATLEPGPEQKKLRASVASEDTAIRDARIGAIEAAYAAVGIM